MDGALAKSYARTMSEMEHHIDGELVIRHEPDKYRYELLDGDTLIGTAGYMPDDNNFAWDFNSTHVSEEYGGRGLAAQLVNYALTDAKEHGHEIHASCSYVVAYLRKHPELA